MKEFASADYIAVKGGGFVHSYGSNTDSYLMYYSLFHIRLACAMGKKVVFMPNSFGPLINKSARSQALKVLKKCNVIFTRESISHNFLLSQGIKNSLTLDLGFYLEKKETNCFAFDKTKKYVAITVRPYRFPGDKDGKRKFENYLEAFVDFAKYLKRNHFEPIFVDHTLSENYHESDIECIKTITSKLDKDSFTIISNKDLSCRELKYLYSKMFATVGTRFHSVIFSISSMVPSIAVTYGGNKGQGIMKDLGLCDYSIDMGNCSSEQLISMFETLQNSYSQYLNKLSELSDSKEENRKQLINTLCNMDCFK